MVYITGDMHGEIERYYDPAVKKLKKNDVLIVCGDFGFIWDNSPAEKKNLKWIGKRKFKTLFVEGCHDNYKLLEQFPKTELFGGSARKINDNIYQLMRGEIYNIDGKKFFAFGGGESDDYDERINADFWWSDEQPSIREVSEAVERLNSCGCEIDYVITHDVPGALNGAVDINADKLSYIHKFLDAVSKKCDFKMWFFGKYHVDKQIPPRYRGVFRDVVSAQTYKRIK